MTVFPNRCFTQPPDDVRKCAEPGRGRRDARGSPPTSRLGRTAFAAQRGGGSRSPMRPRGFLSCLLVLAGVLLTACGGRAEGCDLARECRGVSRPSDCCPAGVGEACGREVGAECDQTLGYRCQQRETSAIATNTTDNSTAQRGVCLGLYNVTVTAVGSDSVSLTWIDFKPEGYLFEYILFHRQHSYQEDRGSWLETDIGSDPFYTLTGLSPTTLYFLRLAVWADDHFSVLGDVSETVWFTTLAVEYCQDEDMQYEVGQVVDNCEDRCTCMPTGLVSCTPRCPGVELPDVPEGCWLERPDPCSCDLGVVCASENDSSCQFGGLRYRNGETVTVNCTVCHCSGGNMTCEEPQCAELPQPSPTCPSPVHVIVSEFDCCPSLSCGEGQLVTTSGPSPIDCQQVTCQEPVVPPGCVNPRKTSDPAGCCELVVCSSVGPVEGEAECSHNGTWHRLGATFTSGCALCVCTRGGVVDCSVDRCPPAPLPLPSVLCPFPNVRRDGCCDTVFCVLENMDPQTLLSRLMALSFGPHSLTLSFEVEHRRSAAVTSPGGTVTQDRYEVMTSEQGAQGASWQSRIYTATTVDVDDNISTPAELLHADAAIRVDDRVYITVDGLNPNTTYYVRVEPVVKRDGEPGHGNATLTGFIVATTLSAGTVCRLGERVYQDGAVVSQTCREECTCVAGHVICESACVEENLMLAPSEACPRPQLVYAVGQQACCRTWTCLPEEDECLYHDVLLKNGEQLLEGTCGQRCTCTDGEVTCTPVCDPVTSPPRAGCVLANVTGSCCPAWMCPLESRLPLAVTMATELGFKGACAGDATFQAAVRAAVRRLVQGQLTCADTGSPFYAACDVGDVTSKCPDGSFYRRRRQTDNAGVIVLVTANVTNRNTVSEIIDALTATSQDLRTVYVSHAFTVAIDDARNVTSSGTYNSYGITLVCPVGFVPNGNLCEYNISSLGPSSPSLLRQNLTLRLVNASHDSATLAWSSLPHYSLAYVTGIVIEVRQLSSATWNESATLHPVTTLHTVTYLSASRQYLARLVALTNASAASRLPLALVEFSTRQHEVLSSLLALEPLRVSLGVTSATVSWTTLPDEVTAAISTLQVSVRPSRAAEDVSLRDLDPRTSEVKLVGLAPGTAYVVRFVVLLVNGTTIVTSPLHFVTTTENPGEIRLVPLVATCIVVLALSLILPIVYIVWRRLRMRRKFMEADMAFENSTYGVTIPSLCPVSRAKNGQARPQDLENAAGVACSGTHAGAADTVGAHRPATSGPTPTTTTTATTTTNARSSHHSRQVAVAGGAPATVAAAAGGGLKA